MSQKRKSTKKISQIKTFIFPQVGKDKKEYKDDEINKWLKDNQINLESGDIMWDIQEGFVIVTIQYTKLI